MLKTKNNLFVGLRFVVATILLSVSVSALTPSVSEAANSCRRVIEEAPEASIQATVYKVSQLKGADKIRVKPETMKKIKKVFEDHGIILETKNIVEAIEGTFDAIQGRTKTPSIRKSDQMAKIARESLEILKTELNAKQFKMVNYFFAEAVLQLETIKPSEFKKPATEMSIFTKQSTLHIDQFNKYVESYVDGTDLYANMSQDGGFLGWGEIRSLYANNSWAIGLRHHDMYHLHYSYGHPYYLAVNLQSSRTINDRRYAMISALWESVDTFTTGFESSIANYMKVRNLSPEEGMLLLATASETELTAIETEMSSKAVDNGQYSQFSYKDGWRPSKTAFGRDGAAYDQQTYRKEIEEYLNAALTNMSKPTKKKYANYHRKGPGQVSNVDEDRVAR